MAEPRRRPVQDPFKSCQFASASERQQTCTDEQAAEFVNRVCPTDETGELRRQIVLAVERVRPERDWMHVVTRWECILSRLLDHRKHAPRSRLTVQGVVSRARSVD